MLDAQSPLPPRRKRRQCEAFLLEDLPQSLGGRGGGASPAPRAQPAGGLPSASSSASAAAYSAGGPAGGGRPPVAPRLPRVAAPGPVLAAGERLTLWEQLAPPASHPGVGQMRGAAWRTAFREGVARLASKEVKGLSQGRLRKGDGIPVWCMYADCASCSGCTYRFMAEFSADAVQIWGKGEHTEVPAPCRADAAFPLSRAQRTAIQTEVRKLGCRGHVPCRC